MNVSYKKIDQIFILDLDVNEDYFLDAVTIFNETQLETDLFHETEYTLRDP